MPPKHLSLLPTTPRSKYICYLFRVQLPCRFLYFHVQRAYGIYRQASLYLIVPQLYYPEPLLPANLGAPFNATQIVYTVPIKFV